MTELKLATKYLNQKRRIKLSDAIQSHEINLKPKTNCSELISSLKHKQSHWGLKFTI